MCSRLDLPTGGFILDLTATQIHAMKRRKRKRPAAAAPGPPSRHRIKRIDRTALLAGFPDKVVAALKTTESLVLNV